MTAREELRMHLAQAQTRAESDAAREHVDRALELVDLLPPTPLAECDRCGQVGPRPRMADPGRHDCV